MSTNLTRDVHAVEEIPQQHPDDAALAHVEHHAALVAPRLRPLGLSRRPGRRARGLGRRRLRGGHFDGLVGGRHGVSRKHAYGWEP